MEVKVRPFDEMHFCTYQLLVLCSLGSLHLETIKVPLERIKVKLDANVVDGADSSILLGQPASMIKELDGLLSEAGKLLGRIQAKL